jgi:hypothetical protein
MQVDGLKAGAGLGGSGVSTYIADISNAQEVVTTTLCAGSWPGRPLYGVLADMI